MKYVKSIAIDYTIPVKYFIAPITIGYTILSELRQVLILCVAALLASSGLLGACGSRHFSVPSSRPPPLSEEGGVKRSAAARPPSAIDTYGHMDCDA